MEISTDPTSIDVLEYSLIMMLLHLDVKLTALAQGRAFCGHGGQNNAESEIDLKIITWNNGS